MTSKALRRVVVVEDDLKIAGVLRDYLQAEGLAADVFGDGLKALQAIAAAPPAAIILDLMLPGLDGIGVCRGVRKFSDVPIIMLTARVDEVDRLLGLNMGADDYVCKPFSPREVMARVQAHLRRAEGRLVAAAVPWSIDDEAMRIRWRGTPLTLTPLEFRMLRRLLTRPGRVFSRAELLESVHAENFEVSDRAIDSHIKNLRRKIQAVEPEGDYISSVYGVGYRFESPAPSFTR